MGQGAYHSLVSEFLWMGIEPKYAFKLAALRYPDEKVSFKNNENMIEYAEMLMDMCYYKYEEFDVNQLLDSSESVVDDIRKRKNYNRARIYIDGGNLLRSYAYIKEKIELKNDVVERTISNKSEHYTPPAFNKLYPVWYIMWILVEASGIEKTLIDKITFVMCADDKGARAMLKSLKANFGFNVITPKKIGKGLKSSSNEDKVLKDLILSDLGNDVFDIAILGTGDGNKKDGISFPEIARRIEASNKQVIFTGFDLTTSKKIKQNFEFVDIGLWVLFPSLGGPEIISRED